MRQDAETMIQKRINEDTGEFVEIVAHELRAPLGSVVGLAELLVRRDDSLAPEDRQAVERQLLADARRLEVVLANTRVLARMDDWQEDLEPVELHRLVTRTTREHQRANPGRVVRMTVPPALPFAWGQEAGAQQILRNFLDNSEKFSPAHAPIDVSIDQEKDWLVVRVEDGGPGLPAPSDGLFRWHGRGMNCSGVRGKGLGLAVSRHLAALMQGNVWARTRAGGLGTEFGFALRTIADVPEPRAIPIDVRVAAALCEFAPIALEDDEREAIDELDDLWRTGWRGDSNDRATTLLVGLALSFEARGIERSAPRALGAVRRAVRILQESAAMVRAPLQPA